MNVRILRSGLVALVAVVCLTACGLQLQGRVPVPTTFARTHVIADNGQSAFVQALRRSLLANGVELVGDQTAATAVIRISRDELEEEVLSVSARNLPREYELKYTVEFSVSIDGTERLAPQVVDVTRDQTFDETVVLAKERERGILQEALARDLAAIVMRRLSVL